MTYKTFSETIRYRRRLQGWSQQDLAVRAGISRTYLSEIERGVATNLSADIRYALSTVLGIQDQCKDIEVPASLALFAKQAGLPADDVVMLASISYRGKQPQTANGWNYLYKTIQLVVGDL